MSFKTLLAYQKGFDLAMEIFHIKKEFPKSEIVYVVAEAVK